MSETITSFFELIADATGFDAGFTSAEKKAIAFAAEFKAVSDSVAADANKMGAAIERSVAVGSMSRGQANALIGQRLAFYGAPGGGAAAGAAGAGAAGGVEMGGLIAGLTIPAALLGGLGLLTGALAAAEEGIAKETSTILRNSQAIGINAQDLQTWQKIAQVVGIDEQSMVTDFERFSRALAEGAPALKQTGVTLKDLGITSSDAGQSILQLADYFHSHSNQAEKAAIATALFGRSGAELIPILDQGSGAFKNYRGELEKMGALFSNSDLIAGAQAQTAITQFDTAVEAAKDRLLTAALPGFTMFFQDISQILTANGQVWTEIGTIIGQVVSFILGVISGLTGASTDFATAPSDASTAYQGLGTSANDAANAISNAGAATKAATDALDQQISTLQQQKRTQDELYDDQKAALQDQLDTLRDVNDGRRRQGEDLISYERRLEESKLNDQIHAVDKAKSAYDRQVDDHVAALQREREAVSKAAQGMGNDLAVGLGGGMQNALKLTDTAVAQINKKFVSLGNDLGTTIRDWFAHPEKFKKDIDKFADDIGQMLGAGIVSGSEKQIRGQLTGGLGGGWSQFIQILEAGGMQPFVANAIGDFLGHAISGHASGTISTRQHLAMISEGNSTEAVLPLNDPGRSLALMEQSGLASLARGAGGGHAGTVNNVTFTGPVADELVAGRVVAKIDKKQHDRAFSASRGFGTS